MSSNTIERIKKKKYHPLPEKVRFEIIEDNNCIQMMHIGSLSVCMDSRFDKIVKPVNQ